MKILCQCRIHDWMRNVFFNLYLPQLVRSKLPKRGSRLDDFLGLSEKVRNKCDTAQTAEVKTLPLDSGFGCWRAQTQTSLGMKWMNLRSLSFPEFGSVWALQFTNSPSPSPPPFPSPQHLSETLNLCQTSVMLKERNDKKEKKGTSLKVAHKTHKDLKERKKERMKGEKKN